MKNVSHRFHDPREPRGLGLSICGALVFPFFLSLSLSGARAEDAKPARPELPQEDYAAALRKAGEREGDIKGLEVRVSYVGDAYRYRMAEGFEQLRGKKLSAKALERKLRSLHRKHNPRRGESLFVVSLSRKGVNDYWFFQTTIEKHLEVRTDRTKRMKIKDLRARPEAHRWTIFETEPTNNNLNDVNKGTQGRNLAQFSEIAFTVRIADDESKRETISLTIKNLISQRVSDSPFDSVNAEKRQISCRNLTDLLREATVVVDRSEWEPPAPPKGYDELLEWLDTH